jgi:hypothetical protein
MASMQSNVAQTRAVTPHMADASAEKFVSPKQHGKITMLMHSKLPLSELTYKTSECRGHLPEGKGSRAGAGDAGSARETGGL